MNLDEQLQRHDSARDIVGDLSRSPHAMATLTRVTATDSVAAPRLAVRGKRAVRYGLAAVTAAAGAVLAPVLGTGNAAFATWDARPVPATSQQAEHYARDCAGFDPSADPRGYRTEVVEVRGAWVMTYLTAQDREIQCLRATKTSAGFSKGEGQALSGPLLTAPEADALATIGVMEMADDDGANRQYLVSGTTGTKVIGVVFETQGTKVQATVTNSRFTAWWPQQVPNNPLGRFVDYTGWNNSANPTVTLTLADGTTITNPIREYDVNR